MVDVLNSSRFFGPTFEQVGGHLEVSNNVPVAVLSLFGDFGLEFLSAIQTQPIAR